MAERGLVSNVVEIRGEVLRNLQNKFESCTIDDKKSSASEIRLRVDLRDGEDVKKFIASFSEATKTEWNVVKQIQRCQRLVFSKSWLCHHSKLNKKENSKRNVQCPAKLRIKIKKVTRHTIKTDPFLRGKTPLAGEVTVSTQHSHDILCADAIRQLRVKEETKIKFYEYFESGLGVQQAIRLHESQFLLQANCEALADSSINPTRRQVYHLHTLWRQSNLGSHIKTPEKLLEKIPLYEAEDDSNKDIEEEFGSRFEMPSPDYTMTEMEVDETLTEVPEIHQLSILDGVKKELHTELQRLSELTKEWNVGSTLRLLNLIKRIKDPNDLDCLFIVQKKNEHFYKGDQGDT